MGEISTYQRGNKPVLALDVDGVSLISSEIQPDGYIPHPSRPSTFYNPEHGKWLKSLSTSVDLYYLTSHRERAHENIGKHLGMPELDWINYWCFLSQIEAKGERYIEDLQATMSLLTTLKRLALTSIFPDRPVVWIDDFIDQVDFDWTGERSSRGIPTLAIQPNTEKGLQLKHFSAIHSWLGMRAVQHFHH